MANFSLRLTIPEDAKQISAMHIESINHFGPTAYPQDIVDAWALGHDPESYVNAMTGRERMCVAVIGAEVIGFASININEREICAVYVSPKYSKIGVGSSLMQCLINEARQNSLSELYLSASLNSVKFYERQGFSVIEKIVHMLSLAQREIECVRMRLVLSKS